MIEGIKTRLREERKILILKGISAKNEAAKTLGFCIGTYSLGFGLFYIQIQINHIIVRRINTWILHFTSLSTFVFKSLNFFKITFSSKLASNSFELTVHFFDVSFRRSTAIQAVPNLLSRLQLILASFTVFKKCFCAPVFSQ